MPLVFVKRHYPLEKTTCEPIWTDYDNTVEQLEESVGLEDAAWMSLDEKWILLDANMRIGDMHKFLLGDGRSMETPYECKFRVGGVFIDVFTFITSLPIAALKWMGITRLKKPEQSDVDKKV